MILTDFLSTGIKFPVSIGAVFNKRQKKKNQESIPQENILQNRAQMD